MIRLGLGIFNWKLKQSCPYIGVAHFTMSVVLLLPRTCDYLSAIWIGPARVRIRVNVRVRFNVRVRVRVNSLSLASKAGVRGGNLKIK